MARRVHSLWFWVLVAGAFLAVGALVMPALALQDFSTEEVRAKWLTVNGPGDHTRPGGWGTMQMINTAGLNAYYASIGDDTYCTWEFHPGNYVDNCWSFGALTKNLGSDLIIARKVAGDWKTPHDLLVDFDTGNVGIGTDSPTAQLEVNGSVKISDSINRGPTNPPLFRWLPVKVLATYSGTGDCPYGIAFDGTNMWTANYDDDSVTKITPTGVMTTYTGTGTGPAGIAFDGTNMWTTNYWADSVTKVLVITK